MTVSHTPISPPLHTHFLSNRFSIRTSSSVKLAGLRLEFLDLVRSSLTRRVASQPLLASPRNSFDQR
jgi:hypothetical protein